MQTTHNPCDSVSRHTQSARKGVSSSLQAIAVLVAAGLFSVPSHAIEFGPDGMFSFNGFGEVDFTQANNQCGSGTCQYSKDTDKQRIWADDVAPGQPLSTRFTTFTQTQVWIGAKHDLGNGFKIKGTLSQNWRDGIADAPGFMRDENVAISHEEYGTVTVGQMVSRTWQFEDYPFGSDLGLSATWGGTGAGYRNLTQAVRYTSRVLDVANGDLVLEATYDRGDTAFTVHPPSFIEVWAHYGKGKLSVDAMYQDARNGTPSSFGGAAFKSLFYDPAADSIVGGSGQSVAVIQATYQYSPKVELLGGVRRNAWSGAYAAIVVNGPPAQWNSMFNVDWNGTLNGVANPGYSATSTDLTVGAKYHLDEKWLFATGMTYLGKADTDNPSDRGQNNSALINTLVATYQYTKAIEFSGFTGMINFHQKGLSPMSMPSNSAINNIDSRVTQTGNWFGVGAKYTF